MRSPSTVTATALSQQELSDWDANGFHVARGLFSAAEVAAVRDRFDELGRAGRPIEGHWAPRADVDDVLGRYPRVMQPHEIDPANMELFLAPTRPCDPSGTDG